MNQEKDILIPSSETLAELIMITELPTEISRNALKDIVQNDPRFFGNEDYSVEFDKASGKGDNYIGELYRIKIRSKNQTALLCIIVKLPPSNKARREQFFAAPCFNRESLFYDSIYPIFKKFQEKKGIVACKDGFYEIPACLKSITTEENECIFMEDLKLRGFEMFNRLQEVTLEHVKKIMEILGKFHAISFAIKDQKMELMEPFTTMKDIIGSREHDPNLASWFNIITSRALAVLDKHSNTIMAEKIKKIMKSPFFELFKDCVNGKLTENSVICHGDCWNNNIMYKYKDGVPVEACLLDWQIMRYSSPVCDLFYYIFCCTTKDFRDLYYEEVLTTYYSTLSSFMKRLGSNPDVIFSRETFDNELQKFGKFGMLMAIMVLPIFTSEANEIPDMDEIAEKFGRNEEIKESDIQFNTKTVDAYNKRMTGVFEDMHRLHYI